VDLQNGKRLPEEKGPNVWGHLILVLREYRPIAWLVLLTTSQVFFVGWMPSQMRIIIWQGLSTRGIPSFLLLVFSLVAVSLVWSAGQRIDAWVFMIFNL
jgi:hypothetical protein